MAKGLVCDFIKLNGFYKELYFHLRDPGKKQFVEFLSQPARLVSGPGAEIVSPTNRGVYGYVSFGKLIDGAIWLFPPEFINWDLQIFPPPDPFCNVFRFWPRKGIAGDLAEIPYRKSWDVNPPKSWHAGPPPGGTGP